MSWNNETDLMIGSVLFYKVFSDIQNLRLLILVKYVNMKLFQKVSIFEILKKCNPKNNFLIMTLVSVDFGFFWYSRLYNYDNKLTETCKVFSDVQNLRLLILV